MPGRTGRRRAACTAATTCWRGSTGTRCTCPSASTGSRTRPSIASSTSGWQPFFALDRTLDGEDALPDGLQHLFRGLATSERVLERYPALAPRYRRMCTEELAQRRDAMPALGDDGDRPVHQIEAGIRYVLGATRPPDDPWLLDSIEQARRGTYPVPPARWRTVPDTVSSGVPVGMSSHRSSRSAPALAETADAPPGAGLCQDPCESPVRAPPAGIFPRGCRGTEGLPVSRMGLSAGSVSSAMVPRHRAGAASGGTRGFRPGRRHPGPACSAPVRGVARGSRVDARTGKR